MGGAAGDEVARQAYCTKSAGDLASLGSDSCSQCGLEFMLLFVSVSLNFCVISLFIFLNLLPKFPYIRNTIPLVLRILLSYWACAACVPIYSLGQDPRLLSRLNKARVSWWVKWVVFSCKLFPVCSGWLKQSEIWVRDYWLTYRFHAVQYLTIIPRARMGSESIAHEAIGSWWGRSPNGLLTQRPCLF